jgi:hypothetical protein
MTNSVFFFPPFHFFIMVCGTYTKSGTYTKNGEDLKIALCHIVTYTGVMTFYI